MKIIIEDPSEYNLKEMLWSGAEDSLDEIVSADKFDEFCNYIDEVYYDGIDLTQLNDLLRFDFDQVKKDIGLVDFDELKNLINSKAIDKAQGVIKKIEAEWEEFKDSEDNKDEKGKTIYKDIDEWVEETYSNEPWSLVTSAVDLIEGEIDTVTDDEEKTDDIDSMIEAITMCGLENFFKEFDGIVDMTNEIDSWMNDNDL